ncbi:AI-2E family transporter [Anaerosporobacter faecicola]|uniref:AI-2E family transporter n=1 Tax=Anaerosporobacter faecicola TaxID=2718714 RepID=UPI00143BE6A9|nr:AI-2E family transporter [Anaerosporobacter faecicola]
MEQETKLQEQTQIDSPVTESPKDDAHSHKFETNRKYFIISIYALAVIAIGTIIVSIIVNFSYTVSAVQTIFSVLSPFITAFFIAYILNPIVLSLDQKFLKNVLKIKGVKLRKILSILLSYLIVIGLIAISLIYIIPELINTVTELNGTVTNISEKALYYLQNLEETFPYIDFGVVETKINNALPEIISYGTNLLSNIFPTLISISVSIIRVIINILLSIVISCYMLSDKSALKRNTKRIVYSFIPVTKANKIFDNVKECNSIFNRFIVGKTIDSLIIGILCYILMRILRLDYAILLSVIVGITNMIPYFGPFIGAVPGVLIFLAISPLKAIIFAIMILVLQQFDGLYLGPKILGESTGLKPLWVIFGITVGGACWGVLGMFLGVPITAVIAHLLDKAINARLEKRKISVPEEP